MAGHDPRGDLAPRDVVAARMAEVIAAGDAGHVWLDATGLGRDLLENGFPTVTAACRKHGIDPVTDLIPVAPGAHYSCGGIRADLDGRTSLPGLYAAGEAASTGVQGANRLASNSVTEAIIAGRRTGTAIADALSRADFARVIGKALSRVGLVDEVTFPGPTGPLPVNGMMLAGSRRRLPTGPGCQRASTGKRYIRSRLSRRRPGIEGKSRSPGIGARPRTGGSSRRQCRGTPASCGTRTGLPNSCGSSEQAGDTPGSNAPMAAIEAGESPDEQAGLDLEAVEAANLRMVSLLIAAGALRRAESRGCHRRRDATGTAAAPWHTLVRWDGQQFVVSKEAL